MDKLFGTDGIRGKINRFPLVPEIALSLGRALVSYSRTQNPPHRVIIARDTRASGKMLESALASGISSMGGEVLMTGILPTPGVAHLVKKEKGSFGAVISASHNPPEDNGIKLFNARGFKPSHKMEDRLESLLINKGYLFSSSLNKSPGEIKEWSEGYEKYREFLLSQFRYDSYNELKVVIDCANGATYKLAPEIFEAKNINLVTIGINPNGKNINTEGGSENLTPLKNRVIEEKADIGIAFDGDGDRCLAINENGDIVDGDDLLYIFANWLKNLGKLKNGIVVGTIMTNSGLEASFDEMGIRLLRSPVGDREVVYLMLEKGAILGGETSGHIAFLDNHTTGDGILTAINILNIIKETNKPLSLLHAGLKKLPTCQLKVPVTSKPPIENIPGIQNVLKESHKRLGKYGRIVVRYSGTEMVLRILVEGEDEKDISSLAKQIAHIAKKEIDEFAIA